MNNQSKIFLLILFTVCIVNVFANHSHMISRVENMISTDDTYYIASFIEDNNDYRSLGSFYEEFLDSLAVHQKDLEYFTIFARAGANSILKKADELQYNNRAMSNRLKRNSVDILNRAVNSIYQEWLINENNDSFLLKMALDMMKQSFRISTQFSDDLIDSYSLHIDFGKLYLALNDYKSATEYFKVAKDVSSQLETQEYADIADILIAMAECNSNLQMDGSIFDYANFINSFQTYQIKLSKYRNFVDNKANPRVIEDKTMIDSLYTAYLSEKIDAIQVSLEESQAWLQQLEQLNQRIFGDLSIISNMHGGVNDRVFED